VCETHTPELLRAGTQTPESVCVCTRESVVLEGNDFQIYFSLPKEVNIILYVTFCG